MYLSVLCIKQESAQSGGLAGTRRALDRRSTRPCGQLPAVHRPPGPPSLGSGHFHPSLTPHWRPVSRRASQQAWGVGGKGGASLLPSNLDSWVSGRKHREADAVIKAISEAVGGGRSPLGGWPPNSPFSLPESQPRSFTRLPCLLPGSELNFCTPGNQRSAGSCEPGVTLAPELLGASLCPLWVQSRGAGRLQACGSFVLSTPYPGPSLPGPLPLHS